MKKIILLIFGGILVTVAVASLSPYVAMFYSGLSALSSYGIPSEIYAGITALLLLCVGIFAQKFIFD